MIEFTENTQTKELKTALDGDNLLMMSYYFFGAIAFLVAIGLSWDFWQYRKKNRARSGEGVCLSDSLCLFLCLSLPFFLFVYCSLFPLSLYSRLCPSLVSLFPPFSLSPVSLCPRFFCPLLFLFPRSSCPLVLSVSLVSVPTL